MKLEYNILWIDNDLQSYIDNNSVRSIEEFLLEKGFDPIIEKVFDEANLDQFITKHEYDLIISDYNLNNTTGDEIIKQIREDKQLDTEILFYTAQDSYMNNDQVIKNLAFKERLTFKVGRNGLLEKIEKVIELTLKKLLELNATRGLITAATSDLDVEIEEIYYQLIEIPLDDEMRPKVEKIFRTDYKEMQKNYLKQCKAKRDNCTADYKQYFSLSDSFRKYDILKELLKLKNFDNFNLDLFKKYGTDVISVRNKFAHAKAIDDNGILKLKGQIEGQDFEFTEVSCVEIRKNLIEHKRNIETLKNLLNK
ncbi:response regulator [Flavobacterium sp. U410]|jgi:CheY-like chemotaxis protein